MNRSVRWVMLSLFAVSLGGLLLTAGCGTKRMDSEGGLSLEQAVEQATSPADHRALAARYDEEANALMRKAERHAKLADTYARSANRKVGMTGGQRCRALAQRFREAAEENRALAKMHREMADEAP